MDWNTIVERLGPRLYNYFIRRGFVRDSADLTQDVFSRLYLKISEGAFDQTKGSLDAFAFGIARFVALENLPTSQLYVLASEDEFDWDKLGNADDSSSLEQNYQKQQTLRLFLNEIKSLNSVQQDILTLYLDDELKLDDIAELMKLPVGTVKSHLFRAKEKLKDLLENKGISL